MSLVEYIKYEINCDVLSQQHHTFVFISEITKFDYQFKFASFIRSSVLDDIRSLGVYFWIIYFRTF